MLYGNFKIIFWRCKKVDIPFESKGLPMPRGKVTTRYSKHESESEARVTPPHLAYITPFYSLIIE